ncbi:TetR/AcrR family transcriptional regulator [Oceanobacillus neutriphilus]|uniref:TetR family transcriptional regulator n=1 Tax=Oceanobacillus neutriphilus TaxID=531815 RepID=A0ABQ2NSK4_9BACI|nr:TetR/AcrR family transcriptional regulator [Oceanobacillus neutriphilus]GGP09931.1 TetR family transcriptional regulator [Oceanobacillus neutriphilus]
MPTSTFFNLNDSKRAKLLQAAEKEFARAPLPQASIANIVKHAGVSRGSFYQYFNGKEDAFYYLLKLHTDKRRAYFLKLLQEKDGDLMASMDQVFRTMLIELSEEEHLQFLKNAVLNVTHEIEDSFTELFLGKQSEIDAVNQVKDLVDFKKLNIDNKQEFFHVMQILTSVTFRNMVDQLSRNLSHEEAIENFRIEMDLLSKGLSKANKRV